MIKGGEDAEDALSLQILFRKRALYLVALFRKETYNLRHSILCIFTTLYERLTLGANRREFENFLPPENMKFNFPEKLSLKANCRAFEICAERDCLSEPIANCQDLSHDLRLMVCISLQRDVTYQSVRAQGAYIHTYIHTYIRCFNILHR